MPDQTREEVDAKIGQSEARTETRIARMEGKMDLLSSTLGGKLDAVSVDIERARQDTKDTRWILFGTILASTLAIMGLIVGLATYGDALFNRGMDVHKLIEDTIAAQKAATKP